MQALGLPVSEQSQVLESVIETLTQNHHETGICARAITALRNKLQGETPSFNEHAISRHFGFAAHRNLQQRHWSTPAMQRSSMQPRRRPDHLGGHWSKDSVKPNTA